MRILLAISFVALIALLWAMVAIMQHVRRARRRRKRFLESVPAASEHGLGLANMVPATKVPEMNFKDLAAPEPEFLPTFEPAIAMAQSDFVDSVQAEAAEPEISAAAEEQLEAAAAPPAIFVPADEPLTGPATADAEPEITAATEDFIEAEAAAEPATSETEIVPEHHEEDPHQDEMDEVDATCAPSQTFVTNYIPYAAPAPAVATASITPSEDHYPAPPDHEPATPRVVRSHSAKHPLASLVPQLNRPDWAYFNKDMGDLSDPEPRSVRPKMRPTNSD
jgi:hypothetical protein